MPARLFPPMRWMLFGLAALVLALAPMRGDAQRLIRDADIEHGLRELARPLISAAGLNPSQIRVLVVNDPSLNAFVVDTRHVFIHSGLILRLDSAPALQSVIAHELAHIANGHLARRLSNFEGLRGATALGLLVGVATAAAGAPEAGVGIAAGATNSAQRVFFSHTRAEEASADQSAVRYMARAGIDPRASLDVLRNFQGQEALSVGRQDVYSRTHPLTRDRVRAFEGAAAAVPEFPADPTAEYWFQRSKGKLGAFLQAPSFTLRKVARGDNSDIAHMRRAVAYHRQPDADRARASIDRALALRPNDPYLHELKGQILFEQRNFQGAVNSYTRSDQILPNQPLILAGLGRSLLAINTRTSNRTALEVLERARARERNAPRLLRDLALAYARAGRNAEASLATAERFVSLGRAQDAAIHAERAAGQLPQGSASWNRAQDILRAAKAASRNR